MSICLTYKDCYRTMDLRVVKGRNLSLNGENKNAMQGENPFA